MPEISAQAVIDAYQRELATMTQRALIAEALLAQAAAPDEDPPPPEDRPTTPRPVPGAIPQPEVK